MKKYNIKKLDARMNGFEVANFKYCIHVTWVDNFQEYRLWLWNSYGPSCELFNWIGISETQSDEWAWESGHALRRLYVSEQVLTHFIMAHPT